MAGAVQRKGQPAAEIARCLDIDGFEGFKRPDGVVLRVERLCRLVAGIAVTVGAFRVGFLKITAVGQQDRAQIRRAIGTVYRALEAVPDQQRDVTAVIDMGMGQDHGVDVAGRHGQVGPVAQAQFFQPLEQPAVDQDFTAAVPQQVFRACYRAGGAEKLKFHAESVHP